MREPGFRRGDQAAGVFHAALLREAAHDRWRIRVPRQRERSGRKIDGAGEIEERRQQRLVAHFARIHELRNIEQLHVGGREWVGVRAQFRIGEGGVGRAEIDSDDVLRWQVYSISISAGATTAASCFAPSAGRSTFAARQPLWRSVPPSGGLAGTLPTNFTRLGSFEGDLA